MKKKIIIGVGILFIFFLVLGCVFLLSMEKENITHDEEKFKKEYEKLNGVVKNEKKMLAISLPDHNYIQYVTEGEVIKQLQKGTSVIYFGFPECPWCRNLVPVLVDVARDYGISISYLNALPIRDIKHLEDDKVITDQEGTKEYYKIVDLLKDHLGEYEGLNDSSIKRLYFPTVVFMKDGKVIGVHTGTVSSQKDPYQALTKNQRKELVKELEKYFDEVSSGVCEKDSKC